MPTLQPHPLRTRPPRVALPILCLLSGLFAVASLEAQGWSPFPSLRSGQQAAIAQGLDGRQWDSVRSCLPSLESAVGATYYAAVVPITAQSGSSSPSENDAVPYADALYRHWQGQSPLDPDRHVLMVVGTENRAVAIHPGGRWADLGFEGRTISRVIDGSRFGSLARNGDMGWALCELAEAVDRDLARRVSGSTTTGNEPRSNAASNAAPNAPPPAAAPPPRRVQPERESGGSAPFSFWLVPLLLIVLLPLFLRRRRQQARQRFLDEQGPWKEKLGNAAERLLELERHHPIYFSPDGQRWTGESQAVDRACAEAVNRVYLLYGQATDLLGRAELLVSSAGWASAAPFDEARNLLRDTEIVVDTGLPAKGADSRRIFLPLTEEIRTNALQVLADLESTYGEAMDRLDEVAAIDQDFRDRLEAADEAAERARAAIEARQEMGLPTEHLVKALEPHLEARQTVLAEMGSDPIRGSARLALAITAMESLVAETEAANGFLEEIRGPLTELGRRLREKVATLREDGLDPEEPGFDPDLRLDRGVDQAQEVEDLLAEGRDDEARAQLEALRRGMEELGEQLDALETARETVPDAHQALKREVAALRQRLPKARTALDTLRREHAETAFAEEADNLEELAAVLDQLDEWIEHVAEDARQEYFLSALADLEAAHTLVGKGNLLLDEIEHTEAELRQLREEVGQRCQALGDLLTRLDTLAKDAPGIDEALDHQVRQQVEAVRGWLDASMPKPGKTDPGRSSPGQAGEKPDWPRLDSESAIRVGDMQRWQARLQGEIDAHERAMAELEEIDADHHALDLEVRSEKRDRNHVHEAVRQVASALAELRLLGKDPSIGGNAFLQRVEDLRRHLEWSRGVWRSEMSAVHLAETELARAHAVIGKEHGRHLGHGVRTDCRRARQLVEEAGQSRSSRNWEGVLELARRSIEAANEATRHARAEAEEREREWQHRQWLREQEEERRREQRRARQRREAARAAAQVASAALSTWSSSRGSSSSFGSSSRGGSSGGSSFGGRSSSGGSSW